MDERHLKLLFFERLMWSNNLIIRIRLKAKGSKALTNKKKKLTDNDKPVRLSVHPSIQKVQEEKASEGKRFRK